MPQSPRAILGALCMAIAVTCGLVTYATFARSLAPPLKPAATLPLHLELKIDRIEDDGTVHFQGKISNIGENTLRIREPAVSNTSIDAITADAGEADFPYEKSWWTMLPVGTFVGPDLMTLRPGETMPVSFGYKFEPGLHRVRWIYTLRPEPETSWSGTVEANQVPVLIAYSETES